MKTVIKGILTFVFTLVALMLSVVVTAFLLPIIFAAILLNILTILFDFVNCLIDDHL